MATPKHILRIHDTEANLLAQLKDQQIAYATDIDEAIWRNGTEFHYLASGKSWNGSSYDYSNIDAESVTLYDSNGDSKTFDYGSIFSQTFEVVTASDLITALESEYAQKYIIINRDDFTFASNTTIEVYGRCSIVCGNGANILSWGNFIGVSVTFNSHVSSPVSPEMYFYNTSTSFNESLGAVDYQINVAWYVRTLHLIETTQINITGSGVIVYEKLTGDPIGAGITISNSQGFWDSTGGGSDITGITAQINAIQGTGEVTFDGFSAGSTTTQFDLGAGSGYIGHTLVTWSALANIEVIDIADHNITYVAIDINGNAIQFKNQLTDAERRTHIFLGNIGHPDGANVTTTFAFPSVLADTTAQTHDLMEAIGVFNKDGNVYSGQSANLEISKTSGEIFGLGVNFDNDPTAPHSRAIPLANPITSMLYVFQDGSNEPATLVEPDFYDLSNVKTAVPVNKYTIQRIFMFKGGFTNILYGQKLYNSLASAKVGATDDEAEVVIPNVITESAIAMGYICIKEGVTDLTDTSEVYIKNFTAFGGSGSGSGGANTNLQGAYDNSVTPQITTTTSLGALAIKRGSALDSDNVLEVQNGAGTNTFEVDGNGEVTATGVNLGAMPTTPSDGDIGQDGTDYNFIVGGDTYNMWGTLTAVASDVSMNDYIHKGSYLTPNAGLTNLPSGWSASTRKIMNVYQVGASYIAQDLFNIQEDAPSSTPRRAYRFTEDGGTTWTAWEENSRDTSQDIDIDKDINGSIFFNDDSGLNRMVLYKASSDALFVGRYDGGGSFVENVLTITNDTGNVEITNDLEVGGDIIIDNATGDPFLKLNTTAQDWVVRIRQSDNEKFQIRDSSNGADRISIQPLGDMTLGGNIVADGDRTYSKASFDIATRGDRTGASVRSGSDASSRGANYYQYGDLHATRPNEHVFRTATTERMRIKTTGVEVVNNLTVSGSVIDFSNLPTSAGATGTLWNDSGTVKIAL